MKTLFAILLALATFGAATDALADITVGGSKSRPSSKSAPLGAYRVNHYNPYSLGNPYGAGSRYKADGLMNPHSAYGSRYSNRSWRNPYATAAPQLYEGGNYRGRLSTNRYHKDSTSNPFGRFGSPYSPDSINNKFGAGNPYSTDPIYVYPGY